MKKITKNTILIIVGIILGCSIGVYATTILASEVEYTNNEQENVQGAIDDLYNKTLYLGKIKVGDYVFMQPQLTTYKINTSDTGYSAEQTINPSELNIWRIISINSDGTAEAVSQYVSSKDVYFSGQIGYKNFIGALNKIASAYGPIQYVKSTRYMGYNGQTATITDSSVTIDSTVASAPWTASTPDSGTSNWDERWGRGDVGYISDTDSTNGLVYKAMGNTLTAYSADINNRAPKTYWLASRSYYYFGTNRWHYDGRNVKENGQVDGFDLYRYVSTTFESVSSHASIRPIITFKSGLTIKGGDGKSESTAWTFN